MAISVQVQMSPGCGHAQQTVALVREVLLELAPDARVEIVDVPTMEDAERLGFGGSPTVCPASPRVDQYRGSPFRSANAAAGNAITDDDPPPLARWQSRQ